MARAHGSTTEECCICFRFTKQVKRVNRYAINVFISYCMMMAGDGVQERIIREVVRQPQGPIHLNYGQKGEKIVEKNHFWHTVITKTQKQKGFPQ